MSHPNAHGLMVQGLMRVLAPVRAGEAIARIE